MASRPLRAVSPSPTDETADQLIQFRTAADVKAQKIPWLLPDRVIGNALCILEGDGSVGKSTFLSSLAAAITKGRPFLGRKKTKPKGVLWLAGEEAEGAMVRPRLVAAGADLNRVHFPPEDDCGSPLAMVFPGHLNLLRDAIAHYNLSLVVIDPMVTFLGCETDLNHEGQVRAVMDQLNRLAISSSCCLLLTRHLKKDRSGPRLSHGLGSVAIAATARSVLVIDQPDPTSERRVLRVVKCNGSPNRAPVEYRLDFSSGVPLVADLRELSAAEDDPEADSGDSGERDVRQDARELLQSICATDWVRTKTIIEEARDAAIGERTLRKAKADLKLQKRRIGNVTPAYCEWGPPEGGWK